MPVLYSSGGASGFMESALPPNPATNLVARKGNNKVSLTWTDPEDRQEGSKSIWDHSVLIRKQGSAPTSVNDGTKVLESSVRNQYSINAYVDTTVSNDIEYFYTVYAYSTEEIPSETAPTVSVIPQKSKIMTVKIDLNDSNPSTCGSYADDATSMPNGKTNNAINTWKEFFGYKPCLFKDGKVVGYLKPTNYTKFEDGTSADITSGDAGDVMVEFPRRGIKISKTEKVITVSMTDDPDDPDFTYYAHSRGEDRRDYFYLGSYFGFLEENFNIEITTIRSISGKTIDLSEETGYSIEKYRQWAQSNGEGYELMTWYQLIYIQVMYLLQFKGNLNSQACIETGPNTLTIDTGDFDKKALIYGLDPTNETGADGFKLFGLENLWGGFHHILDGIAFDVDRYIYTSTDKFNDNHDGYVQQGNSLTLHGYIDDVYGNSELGFFPISAEGSSTTTFCDYTDGSNYGTQPFYTGYSGIDIRYYGLFSSTYNKSYINNIISRLSYY